MSCGGREAGADDGFGDRPACSSTLSGVTGSAISMSSVATRTVTVVGSFITTGRTALLVEEDDNRHEGEDGEQNADQDDEAIRSLHEMFPLYSGG